MNIFLLSYDPRLAAQYHCNKHLIKMIVESAQLLSTAVHLSNDNHQYFKYSYRGGDYRIIYKSTHINHICSKWVREKEDNFHWLYSLARELNREYRYRYNKNKDHKSWSIIEHLKIDTKLDISKPALAMPHDCKVKSPIESYRTYYKNNKRHIAQWGKRGQPYWWE